jgi:hypothetical protein
MYILSVKISTPIEIKTIPDIFEEYFWKIIKILFFKLNFPDKTDIKINGSVRPNEKLTNKPIPLFSVSALEVNVNRAPKTGPIQGVNPKANVKPKTKFLNVENFFRST